MTWRIEYAESVRKQALKLDPQARRRIRSYLQTRIAGLDDPKRLGKALTGPYGGLWRYRVGDYRIICDIQDRVLRVLALSIGHRRDIYRG